MVYRAVQTAVVVEELFCSSTGPWRVWAIQGTSGFPLMLDIVDPVIRIDSEGNKRIQI